MFLRKNEDDEGFFLSDFGKLCLMILSIFIITFTAVKVVDKLEKIDMIDNGNYEYIENGDY